MKILTANNKVITLKELFKGKEKARRQMASLTFEEKINVLVSLQEIARSWGKKKDVIVWGLHCEKLKSDR